MKKKTQKSKVERQKPFNELTNEFAYPIAIWQHKKPAKRSAFLLLSDLDAGEYVYFPFGNNRDKYPLATSIQSLWKAMYEHKELLGSVKACVNCAERELKKAAKAQQKEETDHGKDNV
jgi:hypothetical protein